MNPISKLFNSWSQFNFDLFWVPNLDSRAQIGAVSKFWCDDWNKAIQGTLFRYFILYFPFTTPKFMVHSSSLFEGENNFFTRKETRSYQLKIHFCSVKIWLSDKKKGRPICETPRIYRVNVHTNKPTQVHSGCRLTPKDYTRVQKRGRHSSSSCRTFWEIVLLSTCFENRTIGRSSVCLVYNVHYTLSPALRQAYGKKNCAFYRHEFSSTLGSFFDVDTIVPLVSEIDFLYEFWQSSL